MSNPKSLPRSGEIGTIRIPFAPVAQWIEHIGSNDVVGGSNPSRRTISLLYD